MLCYVMLCYVGGGDAGRDEHRSGRKRAAETAAEAPDAHGADGAGMATTAASEAGGGSGWRWASTIFKASSAAKRLIRDAAGAVQDVMAGAMGSMQRKRGAAEMTEAAAEQSRQVRPRTGDG